MMEISDAIAQNLFGFLSALIGAVVGGVFTLYATNKAIREENAKETRLEEKAVHNLLDALGVEIDALWSFHMHRIGYLIESLPEGSPLHMYYPLTQDYFTIYNSNAASIGHIKDPELRKAIVVTYNKCKKAVDGFKYNNQLLESGDQEKLVAYARLIKADHEELKAYIETLLNLLDKRQK